MRVRLLVVAAAASLMCCSFASATIYNVTGSNSNGDTLTGTMEANGDLTSIFSIDFQVSGLPDPLTTVQSYVSPKLEAVNVDPSPLLPTPIHIYLSVAGGSTLSQAENLITADREAVIDPLESQLLSLTATNILGINSAAIEMLESEIVNEDAIFNTYFAATAVAAVPLPSTWTMMLIGLASLGVAGYRQKQRPR